jgi:hypothetical protein
VQELCGKGDEENEEIPMANRDGAPTGKFFQDLAKTWGRPLHLPSVHVRWVSKYDVKTTRIEDFGKLDLPTEWLKVINGGWLLWDFAGGVWIRDALPQRRDEFVEPGRGH